MTLELCSVVHREASKVCEQAGPGLFLWGQHEGWLGRNDSSRENRSRTWVQYSGWGVIGPALGWKAWAGGRGETVITRLTHGSKTLLLKELRALFQA